MTVALLVSLLVGALVAAAWGLVRYARLAKGRPDIILTTIEEHIAGLQNELLQIRVLIDEYEGLSDIDLRQLQEREHALRGALAHYDQALHYEQRRDNAA